MISRIDSACFDSQCHHRIGILGAVFDPPTISHIQMAIEAINLQYLDHVILVPCGQRSDKLIESTNQDRLNMLEICLKEYNNSNYPVYIDDIEINNGQSIDSYDLLNHYQSTFQSKSIQFTLYFMIGQNLLESITSFPNYELMNQQYNFLIFVNNNEPNQSQYPQKYQTIETTFIASESFVIKNRIKQIRKQQKPNDNYNFQQEYLGIFGITTTGVIDYIKQNQLYK